MVMSQRKEADYGKGAVSKRVTFPGKCGGMSSHRQVEKLVLDGRRVIFPL